MGRNKKTYTDEFKRKCITELLNGKSFSDVCADNSIAPSTLSDWKKAFINGFASKETKKIQKEKEEVEARLQKATEIIGQKELEIELLKKDLRF